MLWFSYVVVVVQIPLNYLFSEMRYKICFFSPGLSEDKERAASVDFGVHCVNTHFNKNP